MKAEYMVLKVWDLKGKDTSIVTGKSDEAVQIMTVHKAKGLAFKIVISLVSAETSLDSQVLCLLI